MSRDLAVFMPDFVGHPICYFAIQPQLPRTAHYVDCAAHWPYASLRALAASVHVALADASITAIVGYSFGAYVAIELARRVVATGARPRVVLIDPPALADVAALAAGDLAALLRARADYAYIDDLIACELVQRDCVLGNLAQLAQLGAPDALPCPTTLVLAGERAVPPELARWRGCDVHRVAGADHRSIVAHARTLPHILAAVEPGYDRRSR